MADACCCQLLIVIIRVDNANTLGPVRAHVAESLEDRRGRQHLASLDDVLPENKCAGKVTKANDRLQTKTTSKRKVLKPTWIG